MDLRPLDVKIISADNIKNVNSFSKMDVYVEVSISGYPKTHTQKTFVDKNGGTNPKWNHSMKFTLDESYLTKPGLYLVLNLKSDRTFGDKKIGQVSVPIHELFNHSSGAGAGAGEGVGEYPVITESGKPKGTLKISYKFGEKFTAPEKNKEVYEPVTAYPAPAAAYPAPHGGAGYGPHPGMAYQQNQGYGYPPPPPQGYGGYPPAGAPGYGYPPAPAPGYGYGPAVQQPKKKNKFGGMGGLGLGLGAGLLGGMLVGDMVSDVGEMSAYDAGYDDAMSGGFDF